MLGAGQAQLAVAAAVIWLQMHRDIMDLRADAIGAECLHETAARRSKFVEIDQKRIEVPAVRAVAMRNRTDCRCERPQQIVVQRRQDASARKEAI